MAGILNEIFAANELGILNVIFAANKRYHSLNLLTADEPWIGGVGFLFL